MRVLRSLFTAGVAAVVCINPTKGDLPIHCLHSEVVGTWEFHLGAASQEKDRSCGHEQPDSVMTMPTEGVDYTHPKFPVVKKMTISLSEPNKAVDDSGKEGTWTMVYDEGFEVVLDDQKFFTFFKYTPLKPDPEPSKVKDFHSYCDTTVSGWHISSSKKKNEHRCFVASKTHAKAKVVGESDKKHATSSLLHKSPPCTHTSGSSDMQILIASDEGTGCGKTHVVTVSSSDSPPRFRSLRAAVDTSDMQAQAEGQSQANRGQHTHMQRSASFENGGTFHADTAFIDRVNTNKALTWKAKAHEHLEGKSVVDILHMLGHRQFHTVEDRDVAWQQGAQHPPVVTSGDGEEGRHAHHSTHIHVSSMPTVTVGTVVLPGLPHPLSLGLGKDLHHVNVLTLASHGVSVSSSTAHDDDAEHNHGFPSIFDWRKIDGGVYMTPVIEQGGCGSCYSVASTDVATMRYRIKKGKDDPKALKTIFSPQNVVGCSRTNQGCDGGYPYLVGKHGVELGFVPESCQEYTGDNECRRECLDGGDVVHAKSYEYVGGYYGAGNELDMLKALKRGPIVVAVNAPPDLLYFHEGVYSHALAHDREEYDVNGISRWEKTNHAIAAVGWGEEMLNGERVKYWICKNSWGRRWGDDGFFYVRRGSDAMAVESMAVEISF